MQYRAGRDQGKAKNEEDRTARKKTQKGLQIESPEENPPRKYNTFKPPSSRDFQNADDIREALRSKIPFGIKELKALDALDV